MKVQILICSFLTLQDGNTGPTYTGTEGGSITARCSFKLPGSRKLFCRGNCETGIILIDSTNDRARRGRYSFEYKGSLLSRPIVLDVSLTQLIKSDSGQYSCGLDRWILDAHEEFEILVTEASTTLNPNSSLQPATTSRPSSSTTTTSTTWRLQSSSGNFTPSSSSTESGAPAGSGPLLYASLTLVIMIIILVVAVLTFCRKRLRKPKACFSEHPVETDVDVTEVSREYDEVGWNRSPAEEVSTVYTQIHQYAEPNGDKTKDEYSLATDPTACPQSQTGDRSCNLVYAEVDFTNCAAASLSSSSRGNTDNAVYSVAQVEVRSADHSSPPLCSTGPLHQ